MKRIISVVLLIGIILSLCACADESKRVTDTQDPLDYNTDFQYYYSNINGFNSSMTKSDTGYYIFLLNRFLYYIDKETMEATPLCSKVNCTHTDRSVCDAYFNTYAVPWSTQNTIQYNNGQLYILNRNEDSYGNFEGTSLYSVSLDGSERNELASFKEGFENWLIHRGYFYYITVEYSEDIETYSAEKSFSIYRLPMDSLNSEPELIFDSSNYFDCVSSGMHQILAYDNYILTVVTPVSKEQDENSKFKIFSTEFNYYTINTDTLSVNKIQNKDGRVDAPKFYNGRLLYSITTDDASVYYTCALDGSNPELIKETEYADNIFSDGSHLYMQNVEEIFDEKSQGEKLYTLNPDFSKSGSAILPVRRFAVNNVAQDPDYFIFIHYLQEENLSGDFEIRCIDKSKLQNMNGETAEYKVAYSSAN